MKRFMLCLAGLLLLGCSTIRSGAAPAAPSADAPAPTPKPTVTVTLVPETLAPAAILQESERILGHCVSIVDQLPYVVDLNDDGTLETVDLASYVPEDECPRWEIVMTGDGREKRFETEIPCDMPYDLWVGDLDEDGAYELFFHGDMASDDYLIYGFRSDLSSLLFEPSQRTARSSGSNSRELRSLRNP